MKKYNLINNITGWIVFIIASAVYLLTIEPTASFWDCGEFISTAHHLDVGHPPGAPFFMIMGKFFTLFASSDQTIAKMVNSMSALASGATILFLFWTITHLAKKIVVKNDEINGNQIIQIMGAGIVGSLAYTFSDSFWFSAVEGEVYATSSLFTAIVFWAILKWENVANEKHSNRWLILIAYLMGLSIGVHLLNLLAIPAIVMVYYFKKYQANRKGLIIALGISFMMLLMIMYGIIPGIVKVASQFELFFVNFLGSGFNTGILFYGILLVGFIVGGIYVTIKKPDYKYSWVLVAVSVTLIGIPFLSESIFLNILLFGAAIVIIYLFKNQHVTLNTILTVTTVIFIGYSSFAMVVIRSHADPPMDQNNPETLFGLQYYLNREQYGDRPLFFGPYYSAPYRGSEYTTPVYTKMDDKYVITSRKVEYEFDSQFNTLFPRMYSREGNHIKAYQQWGKVKGNKIRTTNDQNQTEAIVKPTFVENIRFFLRYQVNFMYMRYFWWNFAGRQNDIQGHGYNQDGTKNLTEGNWMSGIKFIDEARLGPQENLPDSLKNNRGRNKYFMLPFILGVFGMIYQYKKHNKDFWIVMLLFFMTGLAIVLYLNQYPYQPRERDYAYSGSFYVYTVWIGLGVLSIIDFLKKYISSKYTSIPIILGCLVFVPGIMASENWDDHDRSGCYTARDFAYNYLQSCKKNAVLFTNGDNDTFPLWYLQEVEGIRTDVRVCNLSYLSADWYIEQMQRKAYESDALPFTLNKDQYRQGTRDIVYLTDQTKKPVDLQLAMKFIASDKPESKLMIQNEPQSYIPSKTLILKVNKENVLKNELLNPKFHGLIQDELSWTLSGRYLNKSQLMILDLLAGNNWERPIYFAITVSRENYVNLQDYFQICGLAYKIAPINQKADESVVSNIDVDEMYDNMVNKFRWGGIENEKVYLNENNVRMLTNFRNNFAMLADGLLKEGDTARAIMVLDHSLEVIPEKSVPFDYILTPYVTIYYELGQKDKATEISRTIEKNLINEIDYYFTFKNEKRKSVNYLLETNMRFLYQQVQIAQRYGNAGEAKRMEENFMKYYNRYQPNL